MRSLRFLLFLVTLELSQSIPTTTNIPNDQAPTESSTIASQDNKTISELVNEQTEVIRKLISAHKTAIETPLLNDKEAPTSTDEQNTKQEREKQSIEELKAKCEYYFKFHASKQQESVKPNEKIPTATALPFIQSLPQFFQKPAVEQTEEFHSRPSSFPHTEQQNIVNGHYVTTNKFWSHVPSAQHSPQGFAQFTPPMQNQENSNQNFDANANQQLNQGSQQTYVYLPQYDVEHNLASQTQQHFENNRFNSQHSNTDANVIQGSSTFDTKDFSGHVNQIHGSHQQTYFPTGDRHEYQDSKLQYVKMEPVVLQKTLLSDGKTVYYWYKALPGYHVYSQLDATNIQDSAAQFTHQWDAKHHETKTSTTQAPTTTQKIPSYDVTYPITESTGLYKSKLKFVVPVPYPSVETINKNPWRLDPFAYYPKEFQPAYMNFPVPYAPSFHMIRAINVPQVKNDDAQ